jgi:glycosyltransferase involved in cell wall biosynthesis
VSDRFRLRALVEDVVGCGVDLPEGQAGGELAAPEAHYEPLAAHLEGSANAFRRRHRLHEPFILYGGRIDPGKGCEELFEYFQTYLAEGGDVNLALMGAKLMPLPNDPHVRFAGMLPDDERLHALEAASVVVVPSPHESLSLLALEAFAVGTPVLASARSAVLVDHCLRSNAGLFYANRWEFIEALKLLMKNPELRSALGKNGQRYVNRHYRWQTIMSKYERILTRLRAPGARDERREAPREGARDAALDGRRPSGGRPQSSDPLKIRRNDRGRRGSSGPRGRRPMRSGRDRGRGPA